MQAKKHLLVIRLSAMGDVAMTIPVLVALFKKHPNLKVTVLTRSFFKPLFSQIPNVTVVEADVKGKHEGILGLRRLYTELKTLEIDAVADLHNVLRSTILKFFFQLGGYQVVQIDKGRSEKKALIATKNKVFKALKTTHQRYADVFEKLDFQIDLNVACQLPKRELTPKIKTLISKDTNVIIGIAPFAAFEGKMYPIDLMEKVVATLSKNRQYTILLFGGGKAEQEVLDAWESNYENVINIIGKATFSEEIDIISNLQLMLAMDSGNAHLATLFGVKTVTLWGVTHPYAGFYPFGQDLENSLLADRAKYPLIPTSVYGNKMPEAYKDVMRSISPEVVLAKIESLLDK